MEHSPYPVVLDACVLYPARMRDLLMHLGIIGLYQPKWSEHIQEEGCRNLLCNRPDSKVESLQRTCSLMNKAISDAIVMNYESLIGGITLQDHDDRHVVAAALRAKAEVIVTLNRKDFPESVLNIFNIEALHPDDFIVDLIDLNPALALEAVRRQRASLRHPPMTVNQFLEMLSYQGLTQTVQWLTENRFAF